MSKKEKEITFFFDNVKTKSKGTENLITSRGFRKRP